MIVFPMAGLSRRFSEAGYDRPKYMLDLNGCSVFSHAVQSFREYFDEEDFLFIARREPGAAEFLSAELAWLGVRRASVVWLEAPTAGQADTVRLGLRQAAVPRDAPLTIFNIDTFRPRFLYPDKPWMSAADGYLEVMYGADPGFSYVSPRNGAFAEDRVEKTAEKTVISDLASTGLYWFRRAGDLLDAVDRAEAEGGTRSGELYVAPLYNLLIGQGGDIRFHRVAADEVVFCGTPAQYEALRPIGSSSAASVIP